MGSSVVWTGTIANLIEESLSTLLYDDKVESKSKVQTFQNWMQVGSMDGAFKDDLDFYGPTLMSEKDQGAAMASGTFGEGNMKRYVPRAYALQISITHEAMSDKKYAEVLRWARKLKLTCWRSQERDAVDVLVNAWNAAANDSRDSQPLCSASHVTASGATFRNTLATAKTPSVASIEEIVTACYNLPNNDGLVDGNIKVKGFCFPNALWGSFKRIAASSYTPVANNFAEVNVVGPMSEFTFEYHRIPYWQNTDTNWIALTDVEDGMQFLEREVPKSNTWKDPSHMVMFYAIYARWATGWTDPRAVYGSQSGG